MTQKKQHIFLATIALTFAPVSFSATNSLAKTLGWVHSNDPHNICHGYYLTPAVPTASELHIKPNYYHIQSDRIEYSSRKTSKLLGHLSVSQPGRKLTADQGMIYRDSKGKASQLVASGHVKLIETGKLVIANRATLNLKTNVITMHDILYRVSRDQNGNQLATSNPALAAHGEAKQATRPKKGILNLEQATYTTCPPGNHCWKLKATHVNLNQNTGRGYATNIRLFAGPLPFFYLPYFNFPIDNRRYSGFLMPSYRFSAKKTGSVFSIPYYWDIAPNYDATITPEIMSKRGVLWKGLFRYLTPYNRGYFSGGTIFSDHAFRHFKKKSETKWANSPGLNRLEDASNTRWGITWQDQSQWNKHLSTSVDYNNVSDDYYLKDFGSDLIDNSNNQLNRQFKFDYAAEFWNFSGNLQDYRTLHRVDQETVLNQYKRLPEFNFSANSPITKGGFVYGIYSQFVRFLKDKEPGTGTKNPLIGNRYHIEPSISLPLRWPFAYFTPRVKWQLTKYQLQNTAINQEKTPHNAVPVFDLHTGLYFDRTIKAFKTPYRQTLEPEIYYLYVPYHSQSKLPLFDTSHYTFDYDYMFLTNRFSGIDRIGDTNQMTLALTTRFLNADTGNEKASASIGQIRYFERRKMRLSNTQKAIDFNNRLSSPIAAKGLYNVYQRWNALAGLVWDPQDHQFDNQSAGVQYKVDSQHVINVTYDYSRGGDVLPDVSPDSNKNNLKQTDISTYWNINDRFSIMGRWNYNWSHQHVQAYFYGLTYQNCCWAVRFVFAKTFEGLGPAPRYKEKYNNGVYLQFMLKGLGTITSGNPHDLLAQNIHGYQDQFV